MADPTDPAARLAAAFEGEGKYASQWAAFDDGYSQGLALRDQHFEELRQAQTLVRQQQQEIERLREPIKDTYACERCGRRCGLDCVLPNHLWNQIEAETGCNVLCAWCLDAECFSRGWRVRALLAFVGKAICAGTDPENNDKHWEVHLGELTARCSRAIDETMAAESKLSRALAPPSEGEIDQAATAVAHRAGYSDAEIERIKAQSPLSSATHWFHFQDHARAAIAEFMKRRGAT